MDGFTLDQWLVLLLGFLLGLFLGMALLAGGKWKRRYREEVRRCEALEAETRQLRTDYAEQDTLHRAALRDGDRRPVVVDEDRRTALPESERRPDDRPI